MLPLQMQFAEHFGRHGQLSLHVALVPELLLAAPHLHGPLPANVILPLLAAAPLPLIAGELMAVDVVVAPPLAGTVVVDTDAVLVPLAAPPAGNVGKTGSSCGGGGSCGRARKAS